MMTFTLLYNEEKEIVGYITSLLGVYGQGKTREAAIQNLIANQQNLTQVWDANQTIPVISPKKKYPPKKINPMRKDIK